MNRVGRQAFVACLIWTSLCCTFGRLDIWDCFQHPTSTAKFGSSFQCNDDTWQDSIGIYLKPFEKGISKADVDRAESHLASLWDGFGGWRIIIKGRHMFARAFGNWEGKAHTHGVHVLFSKLLLYGVHDLDVEFLFHHWDGAGTKEGQRLPLLTWSRKVGEEDILMPYPLMFNWITNSVRNLPSIRWEDKVPKALFRGSTTGAYFTKQNWRDIPRSQLLKQCRAMPDLCDAEITGYVQITGDARAEMQAAFGHGQRMSAADQTRFKYLLLPDGNVAPATRGALAFHQGSVVVRHKSNSSECWYNIMKPGVHYVEVERDFSDLREKLLWLKNNDNEARKIAEAGAAMARQWLTDAGAVCYMRNLLKRYQRLMRFVPDVTTDMQQQEVRPLSHWEQSLRSYYICPDQ